MVSLSGEMKEVRPTLAQSGLVWFLRLMAVFAMVSGLSYWAQLIGISNETLPRFDVMPLHWQVPCAILAVLLPCASMGMWMLTSWGIVLWGASMMIEVAMYGIWSQSYVAKPYLVISHGVALAVLVAFMVVVLVQRYRRRLANY